MSVSDAKAIYLSTLVIADQITTTAPPEQRPINALGLWPVITAERVPVTVSKVLYFSVTSEVRRNQVPYELRLRSPGDPHTRIIATGVVPVSPIGMGARLLPLTFTTDNYGAFEIAVLLDGAFAGAVRLVITPPEPPRSPGGTPLS